MEFTCTKKQLIIVLSLLGAALFGWAVKQVFFRPLDEKFFQLNYQQLQVAPAKVCIFRPTKFEESRRAGVMRGVAREDMSRRFTTPEYGRLVGRNATLEETIAMAYHCQPSHVLLPADAPTNGFDFLITRPKAHELLQKAVKRKFGYTARWQERNAEVLELRVRIPNAAGLRPSTDSSSPGQNYKAGQHHFSHYQVRWLTGMLENAFDKPLVDKTGLTGYYDFEIAWKWQARRNGPDAEELKKSLGELGLSLEPATEVMQMMVVEKK